MEDRTSFQDQSVNAKNMLPGLQHVLGNEDLETLFCLLEESLSKNNILVEPLLDMFAEHFRNTKDTKAARQFLDRFAKSITPTQIATFSVLSGIQRGNNGDDMTLGQSSIYDAPRRYTGNRKLLRHLGR